MGIFSQANKKGDKKLPFGKKPSRGGFGKKKSYINKKSKKALASKEDRVHLQRMKDADLPCHICGGYDRNQNHHIKEFSSDKKNHEELIPLCYEHHFGKKLSPHGTPRLWRKHFPIEKQRKIARGYFNMFT